jgi:uncharacterized protein
MSMRRKEREVTDSGEIIKVLDTCFSLHVGFNDNGHIYIVPVNFGYTKTDGKYTFYFHGAKDGRKYGLIRKGGLVGFECDSDGEIGTGESACNYTAFYASVVGEGIVSEIENKDEKRNALNGIMKKATGKDPWTFPDIMLNKVGVFKIDVSELTCKKHTR